MPRLPLVVQANQIKCKDLPIMAQLALQLHSPVRIWQPVLRALRYL